jgi:hypothetical protein
VPMSMMWSFAIIYELTLMSLTERRVSKCSQDGTAWTGWQSKSPKLMSELTASGNDHTPYVGSRDACFCTPGNNPRSYPRSMPSIGSDRSDQAARSRYRSGGPRRGRQLGSACANFTHAVGGVLTSGGL